MAKKERKPVVPTVTKSARKVANILANHPKGERKQVVKEANSLMRAVDKLLGVASR